MGPAKPTTTWEFCAPIEHYLGDKRVFDPQFQLNETFAVGYAYDWYRERGGNRRLAETGLALLGSYQGPLDEIEAAFTGEAPHLAIDERCGLAAVALWCAKPCEFPMRHVLHHTKSGTLLSISIDPIVPLPYQVGESFSRDDLERAAEIFQAIDGLERNGTIWSALRILRKALTETMWDVRIALLWVAVESLFGVDDKGELRFRLSTHLALFLGANLESRASIARLARDLYDVRSKVVHGSRSAGIEVDELIRSCGSLEDLIRQTLAKILLHRGYLARFDAKDRSQLFNDLLFGSR